MRSLCSRNFIAQGLGPLMAVKTVTFAQKFAPVWSVAVEFCQPRKKLLETAESKADCRR